MWSVSRVSCQAWSGRAGHSDPSLDMGASFTGRSNMCTAMMEGDRTHAKLRFHGGLVARRCLRLGDRHRVRGKDPGAHLVRHLLFELLSPREQAPGELIVV